MELNNKSIDFQSPQTTISSFSKTPMRREPCKFNSEIYCGYTAQSQVGDRRSAATLAGTVDHTLATLFASSEIHQQIVQACAKENPHCHNLPGKLMDGVCAACRKTVEANGATDIREYK